MKQTAVEWLVEQLKTMDTKSFNRLIQIEMSRENFEECFEQAKAMEEEQLIMFGAQCMAEVEKESGLGAIKIYELYFDKTFKSE